MYVVELNKQTTETLHVYLTSPHCSNLLQARISSWPLGQSAQVLRDQQPDWWDNNGSKPRIIELNMLKLQLYGSLSQSFLVVKWQIQLRLEIVWSLSWWHIWPKATIYL